MVRKISSCIRRCLSRHEELCRDIGSREEELEKETSSSVHGFLSRYINMRGLFFSVYKHRTGDFYLVLRRNCEACFFILFIVLLHDIHIRSIYLDMKSVAIDSESVIYLSTISIRQRSSEIGTSLYEVDDEIDNRNPLLRLFQQRFFGGNRVFCILKPRNESIVYIDCLLYMVILSYRHTELLSVYRLIRSICYCFLQERHKVSQFAMIADERSEIVDILRCEPIPRNDLLKGFHGCSLLGQIPLYQELCDEFSFLFLFFH